MMTCSRLPPWETATQLPAGLTGRLIAEHFRVKVDELRPEHIGEGLLHTRHSFGWYRNPELPAPTDDAIVIDDKLTALYRKYPDLAVSGSVDGLGHVGIQNDSGLYLVIRAKWNSLLEPTEGLVQSSDGKEVASETKAKFAERCKGFITELGEVLNLNLRLVSQSEFMQSFNLQN